MFAFNYGCESVKISFPSVPLNAELSAQEAEEIEQALAQMELWNSLGMIPFPNSEVSSFALPVGGEVVTADLTPSSLNEETGAIADLIRAKFEEVENIEASPVQAENTQNAVEILVGCVKKTEDGSATKEPATQEPEGTEEESEFSCFEYVIRQGMDPYKQLGKASPIWMGSSTSDKQGPLHKGFARQPLQSVTGEVLAQRKDAPQVKQYITPGKENVPPPVYKVRRKPVSHLSSLPPAPAPPKSLVCGEEKSVIDHFLTMDSGGYGEHYKVDLDELWGSEGKGICIRNMVLKKLLGVGGQGKVYLGLGPKPTDSDKQPHLFAIKVIKKHRFVHLEHILREQKILKRVRGNKFLLGLEGSFHDKRHFYIVTDYHPGKDLEQLINEHGGPLPPSSIRFYLSEVAAGLIFLHKHNVYHRDIKPSNTLIKADGHICISDFGLSADFSEAGLNEGTERMPLVRGIAGTMVYMAPEVLKGELHGYKGDWWSYGVLGYNLAEGKFPWKSFDRNWLAHCAGVEPCQFWVTTDANIRSFIRAFLVANPNKRMGDIDIFSHPLFNGIKIKDIMAGNLKPPYIPKQVDTTILPTTIAAQDRIQFGPQYAAHNDPAADYVFYGSKLPSYNPSTKAFIEDEPLHWSPSLYELFRSSDSDTNHEHTLMGSFTIPEAPRSVRPSDASMKKRNSEDTLADLYICIVPRPRPALQAVNHIPSIESDEEAFSELARKFGTSSPTPVAPIGVVRKDSGFRWSLLSTVGGPRHPSPIPIPHRPLVVVNVASVDSQMVFSSSSADLNCFLRTATPATPSTPTTPLTPLTPLTSLTPTLSPAPVEDLELEGEKEVKADSESESESKEKVEEPVAPLWSKNAKVLLTPITIHCNPTYDKDGTFYFSSSGNVNGNGNEMSSNQTGVTTVQGVTAIGNGSSGTGVQGIQSQGRGEEQVRVQVKIVNSPELKNCFVTSGMLLKDVDVEKALPPVPVNLESKSILVRFVKIAFGWLKNILGFGVKK